MKEAPMAGSGDARSSEGPNGAEARGEAILLAVENADAIEWQR